MTYEYTTSTLVEGEIRASVAFSSTTLPTLTQVTSWIEEESNEINQLAGYNIGQTNYAETIDYDGEELIQTAHAPIITVNKVLYSGVRLGTSGYALSDTKVEDTDYSVYKDEGEIVVLFDTWSPDEGRKRIQIDYDAGFVATPKIIQKLATKKVAKRVIDTLIENNIEDGNTGGSISVGAISIVEPENLGLNTYKTLINEISVLEGKIVSGFGVYRYKLRY